MMMISTIILRQYNVVRNHSDNIPRKYVTATHNDGMHIMDVHHPQHSTIELQEFVLFSAEALALFQHKKKERAHHLFEELCSACHRGPVRRSLGEVGNLLLPPDHPAMSIEALAKSEAVEGRDLFFTRATLHAITMNAHLTHRNKQCFVIPYIARNSLIPDASLYKNALAKRIATKQLSEKNIFPRKLCRLSALEKLLE